MSDLTPDEQTQPPRTPRAPARSTRPKAKAYSARRTNRPASSFSTSKSAPDPTPTPEEEAAAAEKVAELQHIEEISASDPEIITIPNDKLTFKVRGFTLVSRSILIWGGITGAANFVFFLITLFIYSNFGSTTAQVNANSGLLNGVACLSFIVPPALAFFAGLRVTMRQGDGWSGAVAGLWSLIVFEVLGLIYTVIALAVANQLASLDGGSLANFGLNFVFEALIAFGAGYLGGAYSKRRRRQMQMRQEMLTSSPQ